jgi:hypothetical protein
MGRSMSESEHKYQYEVDEQMMTIAQMIRSNSGAAGKSVPIETLQRFLTAIERVEVVESSDHNPLPVQEILDCACAVFPSSVGGDDISSAIDAHLSALMNLPMGDYRCDNRKLMDALYRRMYPSADPSVSEQRTFYLTASRRVKAAIQNQTVQVPPRPADLAGLSDETRNFLEQRTLATATTLAGAFLSPPLVKARIEALDELTEGSRVDEEIVLLSQYGGRNPDKVAELLDVNTDHVREMVEISLDRIELVA